MKNLRINKRRIKAMLGAIVLSTNMTACSFKQSDNNVNDDINTKDIYITEDSLLDIENLQYLVVVDNDVRRIVPVSSLKLVDGNNKVVEEVDGIIVNDKIMSIEDPVDIKFSNDIENVIIDNEIISASEFSLVNGETLEKLENVVGMYANYEYTDLEENELFNDNKLTNEKFFELVEEIYGKYSSDNLDVTREQVTDYLMVVNMDRLATDNNELINTIVGDRNVDMVVANAFNVYSAILTENNDRYCAKELGFDSIITVSDTVFDKDEKETVINIENRVKEIVLAKDNNEEFNKLVNNLLMDMCDAEKDEFNMQSGVGYSTMLVLVNFVRINFFTQLDKTNDELIKYFVTFASDGVEYEENSMMTAYYRSFYSILTDCVKEESYTKSKGLN